MKDMPEAAVIGVKQVANERPGQQRCQTTRRSPGWRQLNVRGDVEQAQNSAERPVHLIALVSKRPEAIHLRNPDLHKSGLCRSGNQNIFSEERLVKQRQRLLLVAKAGQNQVDLAKA
jgi:hypothetical protein